MRAPAARRVALPRPASAWALVVVASATLWITGQLAPAAVVAQLAAIALSLWRREEPFGWQRSDVLLNLGMIGIVTVTVLVALRGDPSTIALAHFAALTQGLQLLDARPRRTEFLLVTLALFQVVLAANLTDSVFFPPLLAAFVCAAVWTLMVHTLRMEALRADEARPVDAAITPGLVRTTLFASALSVALALVLFVALPRLRSSVVTGSSIAPMLATAGFSDRVSLGDLGRIRQDPTVVMRIETLEGEPAAPGAGYWRGLAFDEFDGKSWSITPFQRLPLPGSAEGGVSFGPDDADLVQRIVREPVEAGVLFRAGWARHLQGTVRRLERDTSGGLYAAGQADERVRYTVATRRRRGPDAALESDAAALPRRNGERYLQLPELSPAVAARAREIAAGAASDAARLVALERHLVLTGGYSNVPPEIDPGDPRSPVEAFLFGEMAGHCEYFATSMVLLARSLGIPTRLVNGFAGGRENRIGGFLEITRSDAHTWVEAHFAGAGWVAYDPTPPDLRARPQVALSVGERLRQLGSAMELWWFQRVVGFDRSDQIHALKKAWLAWRGRKGARTADQRPGRPSAPRLDLSGWLPLALPLLGGAALAVAWPSLRRARQRRAPLPRDYARALRALRRRGLVRRPATTARAFARQVAERIPAVAPAFERLTEAYLAERFGERPAPDTAAALSALHTALAPPPRSARAG